MSISYWASKISQALEPLPRPFTVKFETTSRWNWCGKVGGYPAIPGQRWRHLRRLKTRQKMVLGPLDLTDLPTIMTTDHRSMVFQDLRTRKIDQMFFFRNQKFQPKELVFFTAVVASNMNFWWRLRRKRSPRRTSRRRRPRPTWWTSWRTPWSLLGPTEPQPLNCCGLNLWENDRYDLYHFFQKSLIWSYCWDSFRRRFLVS